MTDDQEPNSSENHAKIGVIALLPDTLDGPWMGRHQILSRMTKQAHVVWLNPALGWQTLWLSKDTEASQKRGGFITHESGLTVFNPGRWLPKLYKPRFLARFLEARRLAKARRFLKSLGCERIVLYMTRPAQAQALDLCQYDISCYHIFDDYSFSDNKTEHDPVEVDLIRRSHLPVFSSKILYADKGLYNPASVHIPNGVDGELFSQVQAEPEDMVDIPHPRIGYCGVIKKQMDLALLDRMSNTRPNWQFVMVGPIGNVSGAEAALKSLQGKPNVHFLGAKKVTEVPAYIQHFDVGLMCYVRNNYTRYITPLKLCEYMASGIHVVATSLEPLKEFSPYIHLVDSENEWVEKVEDCLVDESYTSEKRENRSAVIEQFDWQHLVGRVYQDWLAHLGESQPPITE